MRPLLSSRRFILLAVSLLALVAGLAAMQPAAIAVSNPDGMRPAPARQPVYHRSQSSGIDVGTLRIPAIGLTETVRSGVAIEVIDRGVSQWAGTARPGEPGNVVLAGHRTTHTRPFHDLDRLRVGDLVFLRDGHGFDVMYRVSDTFIVDPTAIWITYDRGEASLTMFACHPKGSASQRIVVTADLVAGRRIA